MSPSLFEFFELVAEELAADNSKVITPDSIRTKGKDSTLLDELQADLKATSPEQAFELAVKALKEHFADKGATLPFAYNSSTGEFTATDSNFLTFISDMSGIRSCGKRSREFECSVAKRLETRAKGTIHRVGHPRDRKKKRDDFNNYLKKLGFSRPVCLGKDKDGGLDILWQLPLGTNPHRPLVSLQCKNGKFNMDEARKSVVSGQESLSQHGGLQPTVHVMCVFFNDYLYPQRLSAKQLTFVPLGLSDLASMQQLVSTELI